MTSYREAGVDLEGADRHVDAIADSVTRTWRRDVVGGFGGFAAGIRLPEGLRDPVLMMSTDGVGTKLELARRADRWDGVGFDLVAMCVDDLAAVGARALGFIDYLAVGALDPDRDRAIVESVAAACIDAACPLLGGETAEHPGVMAPDAIDLAGNLEALSSLARLLRERGIPLLVLIFPYLEVPFAEYPEHLTRTHLRATEIARAEGANIIDLLHTWKPYDHLSLRLPHNEHDSVHPNAHGHALAAKQIDAWLTARSLPE